MMSCPKVKAITGGPEEVALTMSREVWLSNSSVVVMGGTRG